MASQNSPSYTPGPWTIEGRTARSGAVLTQKIVGSDGVSICRMTSRAVDAEIANARLIAAAPELLQALKAAHTSLLACYDSSEDNVRNPVMRSIGYALQNARYAIAKAEGQ